MKTPIITLLTDFGLQDTYVGVMKGVMLGIVPDVRFVDLSHSIPAHAIPPAAFLIERSYHFFPKGTVHLIVVDPGVGGCRRPMAAKACDQFFVGPDNGVISHVLVTVHGWECRHLDNESLWLPKVSQTFHGRDLFSPVAAHLAKGLGFAEVGTPITDPVILEATHPVVGEGTLVGQVVYIDHYGNLITNITGVTVSEFLREAPGSVSILGATVGPVRESYDQVDAGSLVSLVGGFNTLEIAVNQGSAQHRLRATSGTRVTVTRS